MKWLSANRLLAAGILLLIFTVAFVFFISVRQVQRVHDTGHQVEATEKLLEHVNRLTVAILENETGARGFVITGNDTFLEPLQVSEQYASTELASLVQYETVFPDMHSLLDSLARYVRHRFLFSDSMVFLKRTAPAAQVIKLVETGRGKALTDQVRRLNRQLELLVEAKLSSRRSVNDRTIENLNVILYTVLGLVLLAGLYALYRLRIELRNRRRSEHKFRALLDAAPEATVIVDEQGIIKMTNQQAELVFGYERHEMIGSPVEILLPASLHQRHTKHRGHYNRAPKVRTMGAGLELFAVKKGGSTIPVEISLSPIHTDEGMLVSASVRDITARKQLEDALRKSNQELEAFTYSVSHDLRAPLRGIIGFTTILEEDYGKHLDKEGHRITGVIKKNTQKMGRLIDDLLSFSRLGRQPLSKSFTDMHLLADEAIHDLVKEPGGNKVQWTLQPLPPADADLTTIRQVWINLLSNAMKYSSGKEQPMVEVGSFAEEGRLVYYVKDNGAGFDEKYKDKLFKVFQRLHAESEFEGTGVGLALVEKIISRHGGQVWATGTPGEGATFYFSLPDKEEDK